MFIATSCKCCFAHKSRCVLLYPFIAQTAGPCVRSHACVYDNGLCCFYYNEKKNQKIATFYLLFKSIYKGKGANFIMFNYNLTRQIKNKSCYNCNERVQKFLASSLSEILKKECKGKAANNGTQYVRHQCGDRVIIMNRDSF